MLPCPAGRRGSVLHIYPCSGTGGRQAGSPDNSRRKFSSIHQGTTSLFTSHPITLCPILLLSFLLSSLFWNPIHYPLWMDFFSPHPAHTHKSVEINGKSVSLGFSLFPFTRCTRWNHHSVGHSQENPLAIKVTTSHPHSWRNLEEKCKIHPSLSEFSLSYTTELFQRNCRHGPTASTAKSRLRDGREEQPRHTPPVQGLYQGVGKRGLCPRLIKSEYIIIWCVNSITKCNKSGN